MLLQVAIGAYMRTIKLTRVLYVPKLIGSLISVLQLQDKGITIRTTTRSTRKKLLIKLQGTVIGVASRLGRAYALDSVPQGTIIRHTSLKATTKPEDSALWYRRFGHLSSSSLKLEYTIVLGLLEPIGALQEPYEAYIKTKTVRVVNQKAPKRAIAPCNEYIAISGALIACLYQKGIPIYSRLLTTIPVNHRYTSLKLGSN